MRVEESGEENDGITMRKRAKEKENRREECGKKN
jgi:hypothetical protein